LAQLEQRSIISNRQFPGRTRSLGGDAGCNRGRTLKAVWASATSRFTPWW